MKKEKKNDLKEIVSELSNIYGKVQFRTDDKTQKSIILIPSKEIRINWEFGKPLEDQPDYKLIHHLLQTS